MREGVVECCDVGVRMDDVGDNVFDVEKKGLFEEWGRWSEVNFEVVVEIGGLEELRGLLEEEFGVIGDVRKVGGCEVGVWIREREIEIEVVGKCSCDDLGSGVIGFLGW